VRVVGSKAWLGSLATLGILVAPILAPSQALGAAPSAQAASPSPAPRGPSPAALQAARDVLIAMGADTRSASPSEATLTQTLAELGRLLPDARPEWRPAMEQAVRDEMRKYGERLFEGSAIAYARRFSEAQLADILAFYRSPTGKLLAAQSGPLARERQALSRQEGAGLMSHMIADVCAKEVCTQKAAVQPPQGPAPSTAPKIQPNPPRPPPKK
jgi:hypothetical protein